MIPADCRASGRPLTLSIQGDIQSEGMGGGKQEKPGSGWASEGGWRGGSPIPLEVHRCNKEPTSVHSTEPLEMRLGLPIWRGHTGSTQCIVGIPAAQVTEPSDYRLISAIHQGHKQGCRAAPRADKVPSSTWGLVPPPTFLLSFLRNSTVPPTISASLLPSSSPVLFPWSPTGLL